MSRFTSPRRKRVIVTAIGAAVIGLASSSNALAAGESVEFGGSLSAGGLGDIYSRSSPTISVGDTISSGAPATLTLSPDTAVLNEPVMITATSADPDQGDSIVSHDWDLDNDGTFETATGTTNTVQTTFTTAGPHVVGLRVLDTGGVEARASLTIIVIDTAVIPIPLPEIPTPDLSESPTPTPEPTTGGDTAAPTVTAARVASSVPLERVLSTGAFLARLRVDEPGRVRARLRTRTGTVLAKRAQSVPAAGNVAAKLRLTRAGRRTLRNAKRSLRVKLSVRFSDLAGNTRTLTKAITLRK